MEKIMDKFWELLEESVIVQSVVTLVTVCVTSYLVSIGQDVPKEWWTVMGTIIGFWFGSKTRIAEKTARRETAEAMEDMAKVSRGESS